MRPVLPIVCLKVPNGYPKDTISYPKVPIAFPKVSVAYLKVSFLHAVAFSPRDCWSWVSTCSAVYDCQLLYYPNLTDLPMAVYSTGRSAAFSRFFPSRRRGRISLGASGLMYRGLEAPGQKSVMNLRTTVRSYRCFDGHVKPFSVKLL